MTTIDRAPARVKELAAHVPELILTDEGTIERAHPMLRTAIDTIHQFDRVDADLIFEQVALDEIEAEPLIRQMRALGVLHGDSDGPWFVTDGGLLYRTELVDE